MRRYPVELKLEAVRLYDEEGKTGAEITELLGIGQADAVQAWGQVYRRQGVSVLKKTTGRPRTRENEPGEMERLRMENALLKNSIPNCGKRRTRNAIAGDLSPSPGIRNKSAG